MSLRRTCMHVWEQRNGFLKCTRCGGYLTPWWSRMRSNRMRRKLK